MAATWFARSGLLRGKRSSRCLNCSSESEGICLRRPDDNAVSRGEIIVERRFGDTHHLTDLLDRVFFFLVEPQSQGPFGGIESFRSPPHSAAGARGRHARPGALADQVALELCESTEEGLYAQNREIFNMLYL